MTPSLSVPAEQRPSRRTVLQTGLAAVALAAWPARLLARWDIADGRPRPADRNFTSAAIEEGIARVQAQIADPVLGSMFARCFPNTLDTTVFPGSLNGNPDTFVITGDIDAMWLRDSSAQAWPYLPFAKRDRNLAELLEGIVRRQARMILIDPYANAFLRSPSDPPLSWAVHDNTLRNANGRSTRSAIRFVSRTDTGARLAIGAPSTQSGRPPHGKSSRPSGSSSALPARVHIPLRAAAPIPSIRSRSAATAIPRGPSA
jgi:hypothetical protein